jgi:hypothetical protein
MLLALWANKIMCSGIQRACLLVSFLWFGAFVTGYTQVDNEQLLFEEVHRYVGYENVLMKYYTLPVDLHMSNNVEGNFVDIGILTLIFIPILFLAGLLRRPIWMYVAMLVLLGSVLAYFNYSTFILNYKAIPNTDLVEVWENREGVGLLSEFAYSIRRTVYGSSKGLFRSIDQSLLTEKSAIAYPLVCIMYLLLLWAYIRYFHSGQKKLIGLFTLNSAFLWFILGGGIVWYGFACFVLFYLLMGSGVFSENILSPFNKYLKNAFMGSVVLSLGIAWLFKGTNIYYSYAQPNMLVDYPVVQYHSGTANIYDVQDAYYKNLSLATRIINDDLNTKVYRVGSTLSYFIEHNNDRVYNDNLISFFPGLVKKYKDKVVIADVLKANDFGYIVVGLNLGSVDKTEEGSLKERFNEFMGFLYQNPKLELVATDRVVKSGQDGRAAMGVFGEILNPGTYAIYRIR